MSTENLEQFMSKVADSEELQAKIGEKIDAALIALGAECGCEFTAEELEEYVDSAGHFIPDAQFANIRTIISLIITKTSRNA